MSVAALPAITTAAAANFLCGMGCTSGPKPIPSDRSLFVVSLHFYLSPQRPQFPTEFAWQQIQKHLHLLATQIFVINSAEDLICLILIFIFGHLYLQLDLVADR